MHRTFARFFRSRPHSRSTRRAAAALLGASFVTSTVASYFYYTKYDADGLVYYCASCDERAHKVDASYEPLDLHTFYCNSNTCKHVSEAVPLARVTECMLCSRRVNLPLSPLTSVLASHRRCLCFRHTLLRQLPRCAHCERPARRLFDTGTAAHMCKDCLDGPLVTSQAVAEAILAAAADNIGKRIGMSVPALSVTVCDAGAFLDSMRLLRKRRHGPLFSMLFIDPPFAYASADGLWPFRRHTLVVNANLSEMQMHRVAAQHAGAAVAQRLGLAGVNAALCRDLLAVVHLTDVMNNSEDPRDRETALRFASTHTAPKAPLRFEDGRLSYAALTTGALMRSIIVYRICALPIVVRSADRLWWMMRSVLGKRVAMAIVRNTLFKHFCGGTSVDDLRPLVAVLRRHGVQPILDYAAEAETADTRMTDEALRQLRQDNVHQRQLGVVSARTFVYDGEAECDANMELFLQCVEDSAASSSQSGGDPFVAMKVTALAKPELLEKVSSVLLSIRALWSAEFGEYVAGSGISKERFYAFCRERIGAQLSRDDFGPLWDRFSANLGGQQVDYIEWTQHLTLDSLSARKFFLSKSYDLQLLHPLASAGVLPLLSDHDTVLLDNLQDRIFRIAELARSKRVRLLIDAEQSYLQPCIDHLARTLQIHYNRDFPVIFNTYQAYLMHTHRRILNDIERARRLGFHFAGKLVRGAYLEHERARSKERMELPSIFDTIEETHECYHKCIDTIMTHKTSEPRTRNIMIASHNQQSVQHAVRRMDEQDIDRRTGGVFFAQLYGMADHLTFNLGANGYNTYKYIPYGPVDEVIPYLIRRAQENGSIMSHSRKERQMMWKEVKRRLLRGQLRKGATPTPPPSSAASATQ